MVFLSLSIQNFRKIAFLEVNICYHIFFIPLVSQKIRKYGEILSGPIDFLFSSDSIYLPTSMTESGGIENVLSGDNLLLQYAFRTVSSKLSDWDASSDKELSEIDKKKLLNSSGSK